METPMLCPVMLASTYSNWHTNNEGALWLAEGFEGVDTARRSNSHPWIKDDCYSTGLLLAS